MKRWGSGGCVALPGDLYAIDFVKKDTQSVLKTTMAAVLLFSEEPSGVLG